MSVRTAPSLAQASTQHFSATRRSVVDRNSGDYSGDTPSPRVALNFTTDQT